MFVETAGLVIAIIAVFIAAAGMTAAIVLHIKEQIDASRMVNSVGFSPLLDDEYEDRYVSPGHQSNKARNVAKSEKAHKTISIVIASVFVVIVTIAAIAGFLLFMSDDSTITLAEYNSIQVGMTYEEVCDIIGGPGEPLAEVDIGIGAAYATEMYMWEGKGSFGANANIMFQGGVVVSKAQFGLT